MMVSGVVAGLLMLLFNWWETSTHGEDRNLAKTTEVPREERKDATVTDS